MSKRSAADVERDEAAAPARAYDYYMEHKRTASMSERKVQQFRKKNRIGVRLLLARVWRAKHLLMCAP